MKDYKYIINQSASEATINLNSAIDSFTANEFISEFSFLESQNINTINIEINSVGGSVFDGFSIFNKILNSPKKTISKVQGLAASMASVIMFASNEVHVTDFSLIMIHNPSFGFKNEEDLTEKEKEILDKIKESLLTIYKKRTGLRKDKLSKMMDNETWLDAQEAKELGLIDKIIITENRKDKKKIKNLFLEEIENSAKTDFHSIYNKIINQENNNSDKDNNIKMKEILKILNLKDETTNEVVTTKIKELVDNVSTMTVKIKGLEADIENKESQISKLKTEIFDYEKAEEERQKQEANDLIENAIKERKIKSASKEEWLKLALTDFDTTKNVLNSISKSVKFSEEVEDDEDTKPFKAETISEKVQKLENRLKEKINK